MIQVTISAEVGYGFNDLHVQPKLIDQIKNNKPVVVNYQKNNRKYKKRLLRIRVNRLYYLSRQILMILVYTLPYSLHLRLFPVQTIGH
jgi:hypothetical protein